MKTKSFFIDLKERFSNITKRQYVIVSFVAIILLFLLVFAYTFKKKNQELAEKDKQFKTWVDKNGNSHVKTEIAPVSKEERQRVYDSIARILNQKPRTIIYYTQAAASVDTNLIIKRHSFVTHDTVRLADGSIVVHDTLRYKLDYQDKDYLKVSGIVPQDPQRLDVKLNANLTFTKYFKKKWFLGPKTYFTDVGTDNPYITFTGSKSFETTPSPTWKIRPGIGVGVGYNPFTQKISPEVQAGIYLFRSK